MVNASSLMQQGLIDEYRVMDLLDFNKLLANFGMKITERKGYFITAKGINILCEPYGLQQCEK